MSRKRRMMMMVSGKMMLKKNIIDKKPHSYSDILLLGAIYSAPHRKKQAVCFTKRIVEFM